MSRLVIVFASLTRPRTYGVNRSSRSPNSAAIDPAMIVPRWTASRVLDLLEVPRERHAVDGRAGGAQSVGGLVGARGHLRRDVEAAEVGRERDSQPADRVERRRDLELGPDRRDVTGVRTGDDVLEQCAIGDGTRERTLVAVVVEVEDLDLGHAAVRRLEADDTAERGRDADRTADVRPGGQRGASRPPAPQRNRRWSRPASRRGSTGCG